MSKIKTTITVDVFELDGTTVRHSVTETIAKDQGDNPRFIHATAASEITELRDVIQNGLIARFGSVPA